MGITALNLLWFVHAFTLTTQDILTLSVQRHIAVEYGEPVRLQCNVSSKSPDELQIKYMEWSQNGTKICSVDSEGNVSKHREHTLSDFHCEYENQQLALIFQKVEPVESGQYRCKLRSNQDALHKYSTVELKETCVTAEGVFTREGPTCTFKRVHPDGEVHWFLGSRHLSHAKHQTRKSVEGAGWLTIESTLEHGGSKEPYNCSLKGGKSGRYIASALVFNPHPLVGVARGKGTILHSDGVAAMRTVLCFSVLFPLMLR